MSETRHTSIEAYREIVNGGMLSKRHMEIYRVVASFVEPCTSGEAFKLLQDCEGEGVNPLSQSRARFTELRELGVLREGGTRECKISGRNCITWSVVDQLPNKSVRVDKIPSEKKRLRTRIKELTEKLEVLNNKIRGLEDALKGKTVQRKLFD